MLEILVGLQVVVALFGALSLLAWFLRKKSDDLEGEVITSYGLALIIVLGVMMLLLVSYEMGSSIIGSGG